MEKTASPAFTTPVHVISLTGSTERRRRFAERARDAGLEWQFFDACQSLAEGIEYDVATTRLYYGRELTPSEIGAYSSHFTLWQRLLQSEERQFIILEDDVLVDWHIIRKVAETDLLAGGIEFLRFYFKQPGRFLVRRRNFLKRNLYLIELLGLAFGVQGYVITRSGARRLVDYCRNATRPIDDQLDRYWDHGLVNLSIFPFALVEEAVASTIGNERFTASVPSRARRRYLAWEKWRRRLAVFRRRRVRKLVTDLGETP